MYFRIKYELNLRNGGLEARGKSRSQFLCDCIFCFAIQQMATVNAIIISNIRNTVTTIGIRTASCIEENGIVLLEGSEEYVAVTVSAVELCVDIVDASLTIGIKINYV